MGKRAVFLYSINIALGGYLTPSTSHCPSSWVWPCPPVGPSRVRCRLQP